MFATRRTVGAPVDNDAPRLRLQDDWLLDPFRYAAVLSVIPGGAKGWDGVTFLPHLNPDNAIK